MRIFESESLDNVYIDLCQALLDDGEENSPRGMRTFDLGPTCLVIENPGQRLLTNNIRKINPYFLFAEFLWIITRSQRADMIGFYNKKMWDFSDDGRTLYGAYGPRLMYQIPGIINKIRADENTRQAVATIFNPRDSITPTKDFPCNILLHFIPRNGKLDLITYVRSQDVLLGLPYDFYHWSVIQEMVAMETSLNVGTYTHICGSLHYYDHDTNRINAIAESDKSNLLFFEDTPARKLPGNLKTIGTIEYKNRRNQITSMDQFISSYNEIQSISEDQLIKNQLSTLLYYRIRLLEGIDKKSTLPSLGYGPLLEHLNWA